ncbi:cytochrome C, partial [Gordonia sp. HY442]|nr:cytochrome C [Gordonia zhenghanii]
PPLTDVNPQQLYTAMLTGPQNMPKFSNRQLSVDEKKDIIGFIRYADTAAPSGGLGLGGFGPASEGMVMWVVGGAVIIAGAMWIGSRN